MEGDGEWERGKYGCWVEWVKREIRDVLRNRTLKGPFLYRSQSLNEVKGDVCFDGRIWGNDSHCSFPTRKKADFIWTEGTSLEVGEVMSGREERGIRKTHRVKLSFKEDGKITISFVRGEGDVTTPEMRETVVLKGLLARRLRNGYRREGE